MLQTQTILSKKAVSVTEFRKNPVGNVNAGNGEVLAIMSYNEPAFYCVPVQEYERIMKLVEKSNAQE